jgi:hypothetical protein
VRNAYTVIAGMPKEKRPLGIAMRRCEDYIKMDHKVTWCEPDSSSSGDRPVAGSCEHSNAPLRPCLASYQVLKKDSAPGRDLVQIRNVQSAALGSISTSLTFKRVTTESYVFNRDCYSEGTD